MDIEREANIVKLRQAAILVELLASKFDQPKAKTSTKDLARAILWAVMELEDYR